MNKIILMILIFTSILFASTHTSFNKDNQTQKQDIFKTQAQEIVQSLIFQKNTSYLFLDDKSIKRYYKTFNYELIWINEDGVKNIALELLSSIQNDPVLKHHSNEAFKLNEVVEQLNNIPAWASLDSISEIQSIIQSGCASNAHISCFYADAKDIFNELFGEATK